MNADKSVDVSGNFSKGPVVYTCYPSDEFSQSKWRICVSSVTYNSTKVLSSTFFITCNFVTGKKRSAKGEVVFYEQPLNAFHLKTSSTAPRGIFRFCELLELHKFN